MADTGTTRFFHTKPAYSYARDLSVPDFPDDKPLIVFDGVCLLCSSFVRFVIARDHKKVFCFTTAQSPLGAALYTHYGLAADDMETSILIEEGRAYGKLEAFERIFWRLGGLCRLARIVRILPQGVRDWLYDRIAKNRYAMFGRKDACMVPPEDWTERFLA